MSRACGERTRYRLFIVEPDTRCLLAAAFPAGYRLPEVDILLQQRPARELQEVCLATWKLAVVVTRFLPADDEDEGRYALLELLTASPETPLKTIDPTAFVFLGVRGDLLHSVFSAEPSDPLSRIGWIRQAIEWVESETQATLASPAHVEQHNAGVGFSLLRLRMSDGQDYWLKATGAPNEHEYGITEHLSNAELKTAAYLPRLIAKREEWGAWLMAGDATPLPEIPHDAPGALSILKNAVVSFAQFQIAAVPAVDKLIQLGATDQSFDRLLPKAPELFNYLELAMSQQISTKVPRIARRRLHELNVLFKQVCGRLEDLDLPTSLIHGDLNAGNILRSKHCLFIDWSEAYVGNPLSSLQHLLLLNRVSNDAEHLILDRKLQSLYRDEWGTVCDPVKLEEGFRYMPFLAAFSALYGRGDWLHSSTESEGRFSYARTLARHMDRAGRELEQAI